MMYQENEFDKLKFKVLHFYKKLLLKHMLKRLCFGALTLACFILTAILLEHFFYLTVWLRTTLFYFFLAGTGYLLLFSLGIPLLKSVNVIKAPSLKSLSKIISDNAPETSDLLINTVQLASIKKESVSYDLLKASVLQKSRSFNQLNIKDHFTLKNEIKSLAWLFVPFFVFIALSFSFPSVVSSSERLLDYETVYLKPAPFQFVFDQTQNEILEHQNFKIELELKGKEIPNKALIYINGQPHRMISEKTGLFSFTKKNVLKSFMFHFKSQGFKSHSHKIKVIPKAEIEDVFIKCTPPSYTNLIEIKYKHLQNLSVPEGTEIVWQFNTKHTSEIDFITKDSIYSIKPKDALFKHTSLIKNDLKYGLFLTNTYRLKRPDTSFFKIKVIPDLHPSIKANILKDSLRPAQAFFTGELKDDYGFKSLSCHLSSGPKGPFNKIKLPLNKHNKAQDFYHFIDLDSLNMEEAYVYFEVCDNDAFNSYKKSRTTLFKIKKTSKKQLNASIEAMEETHKAKINTLNDYANKKLNEVQDLKKDLIQKDNLDWQDKQELKNIFNEQKSLLNAIKEFQKKELQKLKSPLLNKELSERLLEKKERLQEMYEKLIPKELKKLLEEMDKLMEDLTKEESMDMLEKMELSNEELNDELERMMSLFKQFEFERQLNDIIDDLDDLKEKQLQESKETLNDKKSQSEQLEDQEKLKNEFNNLQEKVDDLEKLNQELDRQHNLDLQENIQENINNEMNKALEELEKNKKQKGGKHQKDASEQLENMKEAMEAMEASMQEESAYIDMALLERLLDNLIQISYKQEALIEKADNINTKGHKFKSFIQEQHQIQEDLITIEDSLKSLSKRVVQLESFILSELKSANRTLKKSTKSLTERQVLRAKVSQQYSMTSFNKLALMLSESLEQMQNSTAKSMKGCQNCQKKNGKKPNMAGLKKMQKELQKELESLKKGNGSKGKKEWNKQLAQSAIKQAKIRHLLETLSQSHFKDGKKDSKEIENILKEMKQIEKELVHNRIDQNLMNRVQDISTRLLKAENALKERELSEKRKAQSPSDYKAKSKHLFEQYEKLKKDNIEYYQSIPAELYPFYRDLVNDYYKKMKD